MSVYSRSFESQELIQSFLGRPILLRCQQPARDSGLVGDDYDKQIGLIEAANRERCSRQKLDIRRIAKVSHILDDGPVPVEEDCGLRFRRHELSAAATA